MPLEAALVERIGHWGSQKNHSLKIQKFQESFVTNPRPVWERGREPVGGRLLPERLLYGDRSIWLITFSKSHRRSQLNVNHWSSSSLLQLPLNA